MRKLRFSQNNYLIPLLIFTFSSVLLQAQTTWTGTTNSDWNTNTNWDTGFVPTSSDDVIIPNVTPQSSPVIGSTTNAEAKSILVNAGATLDINSGGVLNIDGSTNFGLRNDAWLQMMDN